MLLIGWAGGEKAISQPAFGRLSLISVILF